MSVTIVVIAGLTGKLGRSIASNLLRNHPEIKIHGIVRSLDKVDQAIRQSPKVALFQAGAFDNEALRRGLKNASVCICCYLGDNDLMTDGQKSLIDACIDEKVARYIASDWSMDYRGLEFGQHPLKDPMKHIQAYLEEKEGLDQIKGVHVLNGGFMDIILAPFVGFLLPELNTFNYWGTGDEQIDLTTYDDAATFTAEVAADSSAAGFLNVVGSRVSARQIVQTYQDVTGQQLTLQCLGSLEDLKSKMTAALAEHPQNPYKWMGMVYMYYMLKGTTTVGPLDVARYSNFKSTSLEEYLRQESQRS